MSANGLHLHALSTDFWGRIVEALTDSTRTVAAPTGDAASGLGRDHEAAPAVSTGADPSATPSCGTSAAPTQLHPPTEDAA